MFYRPSERDKKVWLILAAAVTSTDVLVPLTCLDGPCYLQVRSLPLGYRRYIPTPTLSRPLVGTSICTSSFTQKGANRHGQDTLPLHGENLSLPWIEQIEQVVKTTPHLFLPMKRWRKNTLRQKTRKNLGHSSWINAVFTGVSGKRVNDTAEPCVCWCVRWSRHAIELLSCHWREHVQWCKDLWFLLPIYLGCALSSEPVVLEHSHNDIASC